MPTLNTEDICIRENEMLGLDAMNKRIVQLLSNDYSLFQDIPIENKIWECRWYADSTRPGYSKGDYIFLNTISTPDFVRKNATMIKEYIDLNSNIQNKLPEFDIYDEEVFNQYLNAVSGYVNQNGFIENPLFYIGDNTKHLQIKVSLIDDNKEVPNLSSKTWQDILIEDDSYLISNYVFRTIEDVLNDVLQEHIENDDHDFEDILILDKNTDYSLQKLPDNFYMQYTGNEISSVGVDYVLYTVIKPFNTREYQGVRYWHSGKLEHFGCIKTDNRRFTSTMDSNLIQIPFNWEFSGTDGTVLYKKGSLLGNDEGILTINELSGLMVGSLNQEYDIIVRITEPIYINNEKNAPKFKDALYYLSLTPVIENIETYLSADFSYNSNSRTASEEKFWNQNYVSNSIISKRNAYFTINTSSKTTPEYISYIASGYNV